MEENSEEFSNELHQSKISISDAIEGSMFEQWMLELREEIMAIKRLMLLKIEKNNTYSVESKQQESIVPQSENYDEKLLEPIHNGGMRTVFRQLLHEDIFHDLPIYEQEEHVKAPSYLDKHETLRRYSHETYLENTSEEVVDETEEILKTSVIEDIPNQDESEANGSELGFKVEKGISVPREGVLTEISSAEDIQASSEMETCDDDEPDLEINFYSTLTTSREEMGYVDHDNLKFESVADFLQTKEIKSSSSADENPQHEHLHAYKEKAAIPDVVTNILQDSGKPLSDIRNILTNNRKEDNEVCHQANAINFGTLQESLNESMSDVGIVMDKECKEYSVTAGDSKLCANLEGPIAEDNPSTILFEQRFDQDQSFSDPNTKNGDRRDPEPMGAQKHSDSHLQGQKSDSEDLLFDDSATAPDFDHVSHKVNGSENVTHKNQIQQTTRDSTIESNAIADLQSEHMRKHTANQKESKVLEQPEIEPVNEKMNLKEKDVGTDDGSACGRAGNGILIHSELSSAEDIQASSEMEAYDDDEPDVEINFYSTLTTSREEMGYVDNDNLKFESVADFLQTKEIKSSSAADENPQHEHLHAYKEKAAIHDVVTNILQDSGKPLSDIRNILTNNRKEDNEVCHQANAINFGTLQESLNESMSDVGIVMDKECKEYSVTAGDSKLCANFEGPIAEDNPSTILFEQRFDQDQSFSDPNTKNGDRRDPEPMGAQKHSDSHLQGQKSDSEDLLFDDSTTAPDFDHVSHKVNGSENVTHKNQIQQTTRDSTIESNAIADLQSERMRKHAANQKESEVLEQPEIEPVNDKMHLKEKDGTDEGSACGRAGKGILIHSEISSTEDIQASKEMETCDDDAPDVEINSYSALTTPREEMGYVDNHNLELVSVAHFLQTIEADSCGTAAENPQHEKLNSYKEKAAIHDVETNISQDSGKSLDDAESTIDSNIKQIESTTRDSTIESNTIADSGSEMMSKHTANQKESEDLEQREIEPTNDIMNLKEKDVGADEGSTFGEHNDELTLGPEALLSTRNKTMENCESRLNCNTESNKSCLEKNQEGTKYISSEDRRENSNKTYAGNFSNEVPATYKASDDEQISLKMSTSCALCNLLADSAYFEKVKNIAEFDYSTKPMQNVLPCTRNPVGQEMRQYLELDCVRKQMQEDSGSHKLLLCNERQMSCISYKTGSLAKFDKGYCRGNDHFDNICNLCCMPLECELECKRCKQNNVFEEDEIVKAVKESFKTDNKIVTQSLCDIRNSSVVSCNPCGEDRGDFSITGCSDGTGEMLLQSTGEIQLDMKNTPSHKECVVFANINYKLAKQSEDIIVEAVKEVQCNNIESCLREKSISSMKVAHQLSLETWESMQLGPNRTDKKEDIKQDVHTISSFQQYSVNEAEPEQINTISNRDHGHAFGCEKSVLTIMDKSPLDTSPKAKHQIYRANKHQDDLPSQTQKSAELQLDEVLFHRDQSRYESDNYQNIKVAMKDGNFARTIWLRTNYTTDGLQVGDENHMVKSLNYKKTCGGCEIEITDIYNEHRKASVPWLGDGPLDDTLEDVNNTLILLVICNFKTPVFCLCSVLVNRNGIYITEYTSKDTTSFQKPYIRLEYLDDTVFLDIHGKSTCQLESCLLLQTGCRNKFFLHRSKIMDVSATHDQCPRQRSLKKT